MSGSREIDLEHLVYDGIPIAVDRRLDIYVNNRHYMSIVVSPQYLREMVVGALYTDRLISDPSEVKGLDIKGEEVYVSIDRDIEVSRQYYDECVTPFDGEAPRLESGIRVEWGRIIDVLRDFNLMTLPRKRGLAVHSSGIYGIGDDFKKIIHDVSRHASILKIIGYSLLNRVRLSESILITTGRVSSDMIYRVALVGVPIVITLHSPLSSGLLASLIAGVTLIAHIKRVEGRTGLQVLTHRNRVIGISQ